MDKEILNKLKYLINKKKTVDEMCLALDLEPFELFEYVKYLKLLGSDYDIINGIPSKINSDIYRHSMRIQGKTSIKICFVSDLHLGSLYDRPDILRWIYRECEKREINSIFCSGDYTDGYYPRRPNYSKNQKVSGFKETLEYVLNIHPYSRYVNFYTVAGNHDKTFKDSDNKDICEEVAQRRNDIIYLGQDTADVNLGDIDLRIYHGYGEAKKSYFERVKKYYDSIEGNKPDLLQMGHIHHSFYTSFDQTHIFQTASITDQPPFVGNSDLGLERSCWFVEIEYDEFGNVTKVIPELVTLGSAMGRELKIN